MIYKIKEYKDSLINNAYKKGMKEASIFFGINWPSIPTPSVCVLKSRKEIDSIKQYKTKPYVVAFVRPGGRTIYILDIKKFKTESNHKYHTDRKHITLLKHELCHLFYNVYSCGCHNPIWLTEGVSIYLSGQLNERKPVDKFTNFIDFYEHGGAGVYFESGTVVGLLIKNFGKKKILELISHSGEVKNKNQFAKLFKKIYGFDLNYKNFNNLLSKNK